MVQEIDRATGVCPLCGEEIYVDVADWRVSPKWRDVLMYRDKWVELSSQFRETHSIEESARTLSISTDLAVRVLDFLCIELCGCRAVTCVSCLDDYRSEL